VRKRRSGGGRGKKGIGRREERRIPSDEELLARVKIAS
jgi:hypothetical protein